MADKTTEWEIVSLAAGWMNNLFDAHGVQSPFKQARVEMTGSASLRRRDITLFGRDGNPLVTGEAKMPWAADGHSPFVESVVRDARDKAARAGVNYFFTWNLGQLVLWQRDAGESSPDKLGYLLFDMANVHREGQRLDPRVEAKIRDGVERFTLKLMERVRADAALPLRSPDDYFVLALESFLKRPIEETRHALRERDKSEPKKILLDRWARSEQGWTITDDRDDLIDRAAKFSCYATANKIVFYEALRKRFGKLPDLLLPAHAQTGDEAITAIEAFFSRARKDSGDYETIFGFDRTDYGIQIPFLSNAAVDGWRGVLEHVDKFDFTRLDYDVIGRIFEKLISPEERHKYGQYYTRPEIVDLINAFCIRAPTDRVMDPGCGGGTFLVRAYARRKFLDPDTSHQNLLENTFGIDVSHFAAHLTTINLASRELVESENYPRVARADFFDTAPGKAAMSLPRPGGKTEGVAPGLFDAIVANPPYVRQEDIGGARKARYGTLVKTQAGLEPSGRSDLHVFFWGHAHSFLKPDGRLGFLTSSQWLDVDYGFRLQEWILRHFRIVALIESEAEPWFEGARVATAAAILEREPDEEKRRENTVRFVQFRKTLAELVGATESRDMLIGSERLANDIRAVASEVADANWRVRLTKQGDLLEDGMRLGERLKGKRYYAGGKWGIPLRAPDIWFELRERGGDLWRPLGEIADVRFGVKSGKDDFFYVRDVSRDALTRLADAEAFGEHYGAPRERVENGDLTLAEAGTGEVFPIESRFLRPIVHSMMHVDRYVIEPRHARNLALMVPSSESLAGTYVERYIQWAESLNWHLGATCAARESKSGARWYDLTSGHVSPLFWAKSHQYRHMAPRNGIGLLANCNFYTVDVEETSVDAAFAILNSSFAILAKILYGRPVGVEANLKTEVIDVNMMPVPDWTRATPAIRKRLEAAAKAFFGRNVLGMLSERRLREKSFGERDKGSELALLSDMSELEQPDRHELDDAVLELLGVVDKNERQALRAKLYEFLHHRFERERQKEESAIDNKARSKKRQRQTPDMLAQGVFAFLSERHPALLRGYDNFLHPLEQQRVPMDGRFIPEPIDLAVVDDLASTGLRYRDPKTKKLKIEKAVHADQVQLMFEISKLGEGGDTVFVPHGAAEAKKLAEEVRQHREKRDQKLRELIEDRTSDPEMAEKAFGLAIRMVSKVRR